MIEKIVQTFQDVLNLNNRVTRQDERIERLEKRLDAIQDKLEKVGEAVRYMNDRHERDMSDLRRDNADLVLRLENVLLRAGIGVSPTPSPFAGSASKADWRIIYPGVSKIT